LPACFAGRVAFAPINALNAIRIGEYILSVLKTDFVFQLIFGVLAFVPYDPASFHVYSVVHFAILIKIDLLFSSTKNKSRFLGDTGFEPVTPTV
jgi:hypothetical protein